MPALALWSMAKTLKHEEKTTMVIATSLIKGSVFLSIMLTPRLSVTASTAIIKALAISTAPIHRAISSISAVKTANPSMSVIAVMNVVRRTFREKSVIQKPLLKKSNPTGNDGA